MANDAFFNATFLSDSLNLSILSLKDCQLQAVGRVQGGVQDRLPLPLPRLGHLLLLQGVRIHFRPESRNLIHVLLICTSHAGGGEVLRRQVPDGSAERVHLGAEGHRLHPAEGAAGAQQVGRQHDSGKLGEKARPTSVATPRSHRQVLLTR